VQPKRLGRHPDPADRSPSPDGDQQLIDVGFFLQDLQGFPPLPGDHDWIGKGMEVRL
jgi:hypothetical protein